MMINKVIFRLSIIALAISFFACGNNHSDKEEAAAISNDTSIVINDTMISSVHKYDLVISDIPFPFEILDNLYSKHISFNQDVMNPIANVSKYSQYNSKALNLGIYGADLAYAVTYEQFQQMGVYIKNTKKLAEELNIPFAFNQQMMDKYNKFKDNKDSLTKVVYDSYSEVDRALKNDERVGMAALVVTGSWLEGLYLSTKTFVATPKTEDNKGIFKIIADQKRSLIIVIKLLDEYKKDPFFENLIKELNEITSEYNNMPAKTNLKEKQLIMINQKVEQLRKRIIEGI